MEYGPAPEADGPVRTTGSSATVRSQVRSTTSTASLDGRTQSDLRDGEQPAATSAPLADRSRRARRPTSTPPSKPHRAALPGMAGNLAHTARARHLYALARAVQKHARLLAVLETLDNGKPIRETRDIDIPLVARHFYHHAGWAQLLDSEFAGLRHRRRRLRTDHPVELPAADAGVEDRPRARAGCTVVLKPAEFTLAHGAAASPRSAREAGLPAGRAQRRHRRR